MIKTEFNSKKSYGGIFMLLEEEKVLNSEESSETRGDVFEKIASNGKQISVPVDDLVPSPYNTYDVEDVSDLKNSIYLRGIDHAVNCNWPG